MPHAPHTIQYVKPTEQVVPERAISHNVLRAGRPVPQRASRYSLTCIYAIQCHIYFVGIVRIQRHMHERYCTNGEINENLLLYCLIFRCLKKRKAAQLNCNNTIIRTGVVYTALVRITRIRQLIHMPLSVNNNI